MGNQQENLSTSFRSKAYEEKYIAGRRSPVNELGMKV